MKSSTIPYLIGAIVLLALVWLAVDKLDTPPVETAQTDSAAETAGPDEIAGAKETTGAAKAPANVMADVPAGALRFQFIGNEAVMVTDGDMTLFVDFPYKSGAFSYMMYDFDSVEPVGEDVLCLITHMHEDHFDPSLWEPTDWKILGPHELTSELDSTRVIRMLPVTRYNGIEVEAIATPHSDVEHYSYLVTWHGVRMFFSGDAENPGQILEIRDLDVMFLSTWLLKQVAALRAYVDTRKLVTYHHYPTEDVEFYQERVLPEQGDIFDIEFRADQ